MITQPSLAVSFPPGFEWEDESLLAPWAATPLGDEDLDEDEIDEDDDLDADLLDDEDDLEDDVLDDLEDDALDDDLDDDFSDEDIDDEDLDDEDLDDDDIEDVLLPTFRTCSRCGCTDVDCRQCIEKTGSPCFWVAVDLCSACGEPDDVLSVLF